MLISVFVVGILTTVVLAILALHYAGLAAFAIVLSVMIVGLGSLCAWLDSSQKKSS